MMKRFLHSCLAVALAVTAAFSAIGCGDKLPEGKTLKISIGMWPQSSSPADVQQFVRWRDLFNVEFPEVLVEEYPYEYEPNSFIALAESGETPTIFKTWFTEPQKLIAGGYVKDLTFIYEEKGWTDYLVPEVADILSQDGKIYGVPCDGYALGLYMNMDHMRAAGLTETVEVETAGGARTAEIAKYPTRLYDPQNPYDTDTLTGVAIRLKEINEVPSFMVMSDAGDGGWQFSNFVWAFGGSLQTKDAATGKYRSNLACREAVAALEWIKALKHTYKVLPDATRLSYNSWPNYFGTGKVSMCISGNDAVELPITAYGMKKEKIALAPMPAGDGGRYTLYGGSPFMISSSATDDQARMAVEFLRYMGRTPIDDAITRNSYKNGHETAKSKGMPILPRLPVWQNEDYKTGHDAVLQQYIDQTEYARFRDFYEVSETILRKEEPYYCQEMYTILDTVLQKVLADPGADCSALLQAADATFQNLYMSKL